jgi:uncharacterized damage-inducible protein DinB
VARGDVIKHDREFGALFGMQPRAFVALLRRWPDLDDADEAVFLAINGALNNLLGYPHAHHDDWDRAIGVPKPLVARVFKKWRKLRDARAAQPASAQLITALAAAPRLFARAQRALTVKQLNTRITTDVWSINDLLAHLRACADVWGGSIDAMLVCEHPTLRYVSPRGWMRKSGYQSLAFDDSLKAYARQRKALIARLRALSPEAWARGATFTGTTLGREQTVASYVARIVAHEREHCGQVEGIIQSPSSPRPSDAPACAAGRSDARHPARHDVSDPRRTRHP